MSKDEIGQDILFSGDESDTLFLSSPGHDHAALEKLKNFSYMLGEAGEEFSGEPVVYDSNYLEADIPVAFDDGFVDVEQIVAAAESTTGEPLVPTEPANVIPDLAESAIDLDMLFDAMQISSTTHSEDALIPDVSQDTAQEMTMLNSATLPASVLDSLDPSDGIDDLFKKLVIADES